MIQKELPLWLDEEEVEKADETLQLHMIEQSLGEKPTIEDDFLGQFINSSPLGDFMELFNSGCATQHIDSIPSSSTTPDTTSTLQGDSTIREVEIEPSKTLNISSALSI